MEEENVLLSCTKHTVTKYNNKGYISLKIFLLIITLTLYFHLLVHIMYTSYNVHMGFCASQRISIVLEIPPCFQWFITARVSQNVRISDFFILQFCIKASLQKLSIFWKYQTTHFQTHLTGQELTNLYCQALVPNPNPLVPNPPRHNPNPDSTPIKPKGDWGWH